MTGLHVEDEFYDFLAGCGKAMILCSAVDMGFDALMFQRGAMTAEEICQWYGLHPLRGHKWVLLLEQTGLLVEQPAAHGPSRYTASPLLRAFADPSVMYFYREFLRYWRISVVRDVPALLRGGPVDNPVRYPPLADTDVELLHEWMRTGVHVTVAAITRHFDFAKVKRVLDVGGGDATMAVVLAHRHFNLHITVFNIPKVAEMGRRHIEQSGMGVRVGVHEGNFLTDPLPKQGYDLVMFSRVLADWPPEVCDRLLGEAYAALADGGQLLIAEPFRDHNPALALAWEHSYLTYDDFGAYTYKTTTFYREMIEAAGFHSVTVHPRGDSIHGVITAHKTQPPPVEQESPAT